MKVGDLVRMNPDEIFNKALVAIHGVGIIIDFDWKDSLDMPGHPRVLWSKSGVAQIVHEGILELISESR